MKDFVNRYAVITGAGTGMGRELAVQLIGQGCHVAMCDLSMSNLIETKRLCSQVAPKGTLVSVSVADVSVESELQAWAETVQRELKTSHINLLFNNAGIGGGDSIIIDKRAHWDRVFATDWGGVYYGVRTFLPLLLKASEGHIINTSSLNGLWASLGPDRAHTAYCAAKFAVRGFSEALQTDLALNAPHIKCSVVFPGHIGTDIAINTLKIISENSSDLSIIRARFQKRGIDLSSSSDDEVRTLLQAHGAAFRDNAPMTAAQAASCILEGVKSGRWRILVGKDAEIVDRMVRSEPEEVYSREFFSKLQAAGLFNL